MARPTVYLDTSVINFLFADDAPEFKTITIEFFERHATGSRYDIRVSEVVLQEIAQTRDANRREQLFDAIELNNFPVMPLTREAQSLAQAYLNQGALPRSKINDALHVAIATCGGIDYLLSWNFRHLANARRQELIRDINRAGGFSSEIALTTPLELMDETDEV